MEIDKSFCTLVICLMGPIPLILVDASSHAMLCMIDNYASFSAAFSAAVVLS